jgi:hypothetical protein
LVPDTGEKKEGKFRDRVLPVEIISAWSANEWWPDLWPGCQIFLGTWYQNRKKYTKWIKKYTKWIKNIPNEKNVPNGHKISHISIKYSKWSLNIYVNIFQSKALKNLPKLGFWFENKPSGNPGAASSRKGRLSFLSCRVFFPTSEIMLKVKIFSLKLSTSKCRHH